jgi:uncharacterized RDD family membrane protein YckC
MKESYTVDYAGFWFRLAALLIDVLVLWGINYLMTGIWNVSTGFPWNGVPAAQLEDTLTATVSHVGWRWLVFFIIFTGYFIGFWAWRGQTPGKMLTRIKITLLDGSRIGWKRAFSRFIGYLLSMVFLFVGFLWLAFDSRRQGFHDKLADTYVIRVPRKEAEIPAPVAG